ncbi:Phosphatidylinositol alpha-mannosyltransferase [Quadrisphaera granulorum]|uniref:Phosphatidylinositol alpha-mannosyltransferase n=1 Tax=Quadrisphaera granulorum TaxID=317664 RepID=A0A316A7V0_9ACTN|nr:glycosyltransferase family 4 protein [Quadrisphaera granulorum]PWJ53519.1 phosphatidylinositol alpha-mannosyltransferase [Quadrisphaera granulorum]SZE96861.1 Phosphatidylinositol alpha-mannosyltransferase [Quadrisphaera granulorum]
MRVGLVCPYSFDVPGGVQAHVSDLAEVLLEQGHEVSVLAPVSEPDSASPEPLPPWLVSAGGAVPVSYNGSVARVSFGPVVGLRVRRWLAEGHFDVVHLHEPVTPSIALIAMLTAEAPLVATFHTASLRSRALQAALPLVRPGLEKLSARIAVSEDARRRVVEHLGGDAVVVPNGVSVDRYAAAPVRQEWRGRPGAPVLLFLGRFEEPRKGFGVLAQALPALRAAHPGLRVLVAGRGDPRVAHELAGDHAECLEMLGSVSEADKASLLASADLYVAPQTAGESFGIVLVEAMSAGTPVLASALPAFSRVLDGGTLGELVPVGDPAALAEAAAALLDDDERRRAVAAAASRAVRRYDWSVVAHQVLTVYETVLSGVHGTAAALGEPGGDPAAGRLLAQWRGAEVLP